MSNEALVITNETPLTEMDEDITFRGALYFYSKGSARDVFLDFEFSHAFADDYDGPAPAAYKCLRDVGLSVGRSADRLQDIGLDENELNELSPEDKRDAVLDAYAKAIPDESGSVH